MPYGVFDQLGISLDSEHVHDPVLVEGHSSGLEFQYPGDFLQGLAFGEELQNFAVPARNAFFFSVDCSYSEKEFHGVFGDRGGQVGFALEDSTHRNNQVLNIGMLKRVFEKVHAGAS
jgi:hypothetical protein